MAEVPQENLVEVQIVNILIINQPIKNRGDESAHRGLVRTLAKTYPRHGIRVVWMGEDPPGCDPMHVDEPNVEYEIIPMKWGRARLPRFALMYRLGWLLGRIHPGYRAYRTRIREADLVVSAPSGIMLGAFRTWKTLYHDLLVRAEGKPFAYYSPSFGPKPEGRKGDALFWRLSTDVLKGLDFLSIRDKKTMELADSMGISYEPSIDSAFLDSPASSTRLPPELETKIAGRPLVVFVPNSLTWHVAYRKADQCRIDRFYLDVATVLQRRFPEAAITFLPQLFGRGKAGGDHEYFEKLAARAPLHANWLVLGDHYGSDIQQTLISRAELVVGARYHSIVFAINNGVPFVSLSYEHKMDGLLECLQLGNRAVDIRQLGTSGFDAAAALEAIGSLCGSLRKPLEAREKAKAIAGATFRSFCERFAFLDRQGGGHG